MAGVAHIGDKTGMHGWEEERVSSLEHSAILANMADVLTECSTFRLVCL